MTKFGPSTILKLFAGVLLRILRRVSPSRFVTVTRSFRASHCRAGCAAIASLLVLSGCAGVQVKLGWKVDLAKTPVTSIAVAMPKATGLAPGEKSPLVVTVAGPDGKVLVTEGAADGKVMWKDLKVEATVVTANQKGVVSLSTDPQISDGQLPHVTITVPSHPDLRADLDIPVQYNRKFQAQFSGASGFSGSSGSDGRSGSSGSSGSTDPDHPSAGGNGEDGGNGGDGGDGGSGGDGPPVDVVVTLKSGSHPLLQVKVVAEGRTRLFLVDPDGG